MSGRPGMLINLPPPDSDPANPNEQGPGTPNSGTTSLSTLSVVAIKDGTVGHSGHSGHNRGTTSSANTLDAERADRISRLPGLERVATVRSTGPSGAPGPQGGPPYHPPTYQKEISTVGSASATGSVGGKTTWADQSMAGDYDDADKMSEDQDQEAEAHEDDGVSSMGGLLGDDEDKDSLVGFGEGAGSTVSGPVSTANSRMIAHAAVRNSMNSAAAPRTQQQPMLSSGGSTPMSGIETTTTTRPSAAGAEGAGGVDGRDPKMMDGITFDQGVVDTTVSRPPGAAEESGGRFSGFGAQMAENALRGRMDDGDQRGMITPPNNQSLGRFGFEDR